MSNLIDFGVEDAPADTAAAAGSGGWEEESWAEVDDGWESLELGGDSSDKKS